MSDAKQSWWHGDFGIRDLLWMIPVIFLVAYVAGATANWLNGYGWGIHE